MDSEDAVTPESSELTRELIRMATSVTAPRGTVLFRCGEPVTGVYIVQRGLVRMSLEAPNCEFADREVGPGEIAGLPATLTGTYSLSAEVTEDAELGFVPADSVSGALECSPHLCFAAMRVIGEEIARTRAGLRENMPELLHEAD